MTLPELIARLEQATEGSRELDLEILNAISSQKWVWRDRERQTVTCDRYGANAIGNPVCSLDRFTFSVDDALTMVPEGCWTRIQICKNARAERSFCHCKIISDADTRDMDDVDPIEVDANNAPTAPLAICLAAMRARLAMEGDDGRDL